MPAAFLILALVLEACGFRSHIEPLEVATPPSQPFGVPGQATAGLAVIPSATPVASFPSGELTSAQAIELCGRLEYYGDESVGMCLAPGGESYYVWVNPSLVVEVDRNNAQIEAFRFAVQQRAAAQSTFQDRLFDLAKSLAPLTLEVAGLTSCGVAATPGPQQLVAVPICIADILAIGFTGVAVSRDAEAAVSALAEFYQRNLDAGYVFCLMQGGTDAQCR